MIPLSNEKRKMVVTYVQHGVSPAYKPLLETQISTDVKRRAFDGKEYDFVVFWSNRNIRRKQAPDVIWAYKKFCDALTAEQRDRTLLFMHTAPVDQNGTDLPEVINNIAPGVNVRFSDGHLPTEQINEIINLSDISVNISGNEGFGLTTAEGIMAGLPSVVLVTGGLQDQCGFRWKDSGELITAEDYVKIGSLHDWRLWETKVTHGEWVKPVWARAQTMAGSVPTPYIIDDKVDIYELADAFRYWYDIPKEERKTMGLKGREYFLSEDGFYAQRMCDKMVEGMEKGFANWTPRKRHEIFQVL